MAANVNIFDKYGIKEVANVYFEALESDPAANIYKGDIVLYLDTLKVSTIETTAEQTDATGGWGNPKLITWDYGKEITLTLEDALISLESLRFMMGGAIHRPSGTTETAGDTVIVRHAETVVAETGGIVPKPKDHITGEELTPEPSVQHPLRLINATKGLRTQITSGSYTGTDIIKFKNDAMGASTAVATEAGDRIIMFWEEELTGDTNANAAVEITISPDTYPGTYRVVGDTFIRNQGTGKDEAFQFVIGKAKVSSEVTITLEAEGDPSTFEMTLTVLRADNERGEREMMKLIRYGGSRADESAAGDDIGSIGSGS